MTPKSFTKIALIGTVFAAAFSGASFAHDATLSGPWKIDAARFYDRQASLWIERDTTGANQTSGQFIVVDGENVYLASGMDAHAMNMSTAKMAAGGKLVLIGKYAHRTDVCTLRCRLGQPERRMTLQFTTVEGSEQFMGDMVAYNKK